MHAAAGKRLLGTAAASLGVSGAILAQAAARMKVGGEYLRKQAQLRPGFQPNAPLHVPRRIRSDALRQDHRAWLCYSNYTPTATPTAVCVLLMPVDSPPAPGAAVTRSRARSSATGTSAPARARVTATRGAICSAGRLGAPRHSLAGWRPRRWTSGPGDDCMCRPRGRDGSGSPPTAP